MVTDSHESELLRAAELGELTTVRRLVEDPHAGVDLECRTEYGETPLILAAQNGHVDVVQFLLEAGADVHATDGGGEDALIRASINPGAAPALEVLLAAGASVDRRDKVGATALIRAAGSGNAANAAVLLRHGANPNVVTDELETALTFAIVWEHPDVVELLLNAGAAVDQRDDRGATALTYAVHGMRLEPDPDGITDEQERTVLYERLVELLLNAGAAVDQRDDKGWTPLTYAVYSGSPAIVRRLLEAGADPNQVDGEGNTLRTHVSQSGNTGLIELLWPGDDAGA